MWAGQHSLPSILMMHNCLHKDKFFLIIYDSFSIHDSFTVREVALRETMNMDALSASVFRQSLTHGEDFPILGQCEMLSIQQKLNLEFRIVIKQNKIKQTRPGPLLHIVLQSSSEPWLPGKRPYPVERRGS